jgi:membrane associated rhomboid family serine protease
MIPLYDRNPTTTRPIVTVILIAACIAVYFLIQPHDQQVDDAVFTYGHAAIPCELVKGHEITEVEAETGHCQSHPESAPAFPGKNIYLAVLYSMFLHGSLLHLGGNMLFLWVFGNNIEDTAGKPLYVLFYLAAGLVATLAQVAIDPGSTVPMIGASGAIAGVMGAYLVVFPNVRIHSLIFLGFFIFFREISAKWLLIIWFVTQFFTGPNSGVAWMAHVGGFVFGVAAGLVWKNTRATPTAAASYGW